MVDAPGNDYWQRWLSFVTEVLVKRSLISPDDVSLFKVTDSVDAAVAEVLGFYRVYHSMRYVRGDLVLRLQRPLSEATLERLRGEFRDIVKAGTLEQTNALPEEANEPDLAKMPRLKNQLALQQILGVIRSQPAAVFGDADGHDLVFIFIDGLQNRRGREQRNLVLSTAPAEKNADPKLFHVCL